MNTNTEMEAEAKFEAALVTLFAEFPELKDWPLGDLLQTLGSVSPYMSSSSARIQSRFNELKK